MYRIFLTLLSLHPNLLLCVAASHHVDTVFEYDFFDKELVDRQDIAEYFQYSKTKVGWAEVVRCTYGAHIDPLLQYQIASCFVGLTMDNLLQRSSDQKGIWFHLKFGRDQRSKQAFDYFLAHFDRRNNYFGFAAIHGPKSSGNLIKPETVIQQSIKTKIVIMFDEGVWLRGAESSPGYTLEHLYGMREIVTNPDPYGNDRYCALDIFYLARTMVGMSALKDLRVILYQQSHQPQPNLIMLRSRVRRLQSVVKQLLLLIDADTEVRLQSNFPVINWNLRGSREQLNFPSHRSLVEFFRKDDRLLRANPIACGGFYTLTELCGDAPPLRLDYLLQAADSGMAIVLKFTESKVALREIPFDSYRYPPMVLLEAVPGPNAPLVAPDVNVAEAINPRARVRYVFGFVERKTMAYERQQVDALIDILNLGVVRNLSAFGIRLRVDLLAHEGVEDILKPLFHWHRFKWLLLYQPYYINSGLSAGKFDLTEHQVKILKRNVRPLMTRDTYLLVNEKLWQQIYSDESLPGMTIPPKDTTTASPTTIVVTTPSNSTGTTRVTRTTAVLKGESGGSGRASQWGWVGMLLWFLSLLLF